MNSSPPWQNLQRAEEATQSVTEGSCKTEGRAERVRRTYSMMAMMDSPSSFTSYSRTMCDEDCAAMRSRKAGDDCSDAGYDDG